MNYPGQQKFNPGEFESLDGDQNQNNNGQQ